MYMMSIENYKCNDCNKTYSCYRTLWAHNKNHHNGIKIVKTENIVEEKKGEYGCKKCNKQYKHSQTRNCHEKKCIGTKESNIIVIETEKMKQLTLDKEVEVEKTKQETIKLQIKLQGMTRLDNKTFKAMNKILMNRSTTNNITNIQNNTIINNFQIFSIGNEDVVNTLSLDDKQFIIDRKWCSLDKMVEMVHCGDHNMFKNILITNLKDKFAYTFDDKKGYFITTTKTYILDDLITNRMLDIETIYDELITENLIDEKTKKMIRAFLDRMEEDDKPYTDEVEDVEHVNYKAYKTNLIKILLYNNQEKITKDIALLMN